MFDREVYANAIYDVNYVYKRIDKGDTAGIVQFRQNDVPDTNLNLIKKNLKVDQIHVVIEGLDTVDFGTKDMYTCIQKPQVGVMKDTTSKAGTVDWTGCVAWSKDMGR